MSFLSADEDDDDDVTDVPRVSENLDPKPLSAASASLCVLEMTGVADLTVGEDGDGREEEEEGMD